MTMNRTLIRTAIVTALLAGMVSQAHASLITISTDTGASASTR